MKGEPDWMRDFRLESLGIFESKPMPKWGGRISVDFQDIYYYLKPTDKQGHTWEEVPQEIKETFEKLGIPEAEKKFLAGVKAQFESEVVYGSLKEDLGRQGVIFTDTDSAVRQHPDLVREYFGTIIPPHDNKFAALNSAVWSGGSFIYVPPGVKIDFPLQAYFRINAENMGQFERTLIIVDEGAEVHYVEGCTAPMYSTESLHSAVVEIIVKRGARCRYTTIQNWANNIYNLVTKRAVAYGDATMEWIDGNLGSRLTMKYPAVYMREPGARGEILSIAFAGAASTRTPGQTRPLCPQHDRPDHLQVDLQERRTKQLSRPGAGGKGCEECQVQGGLRRPDPGPEEPQRHVSLHRDRGAGRLRRPRGQRFPDRRGAAVLPDEPRTDGGRSQHDDRQRLHRAAGQGTAHGIRRGDEPADPIADGRLGWLRPCKPPCASASTRTRWMPCRGPLRARVGSEPAAQRVGGVSRRGLAVARRRGMATHGHPLVSPGQTTASPGTPCAPRASRGAVECRRGSSRGNRWP